MTNNIKSLVRACKALNTSLQHATFTSEAAYLGGMGFGFIHRLFDEIIKSESQHVFNDDNNIFIKSYLQV